MKIYAPNYNSNNCAVIQNNNTLRIYERKPTQNSNVNYTDYYYNSHYYYTTGTQNFSQYSIIPNCISNNDMTTEVYYRNDFVDILIMFYIFCIFCIYLPIRIYAKLFKRLRI